MMRLEMKNYNMILTEKAAKYQHSHQVLINMNILQVKKYYLLINEEGQNKALEKQRKTIEDPGRKQIDVIKNQNERLAVLTNKDYDKDNYKEIFEELVKARFDEIKELADETNQNDIIYYFKGNTARKRFDELNNGI